MNFQIEFLKNKIIETEDKLRAIQEREQFLETEIKVVDEAKRLLEMLKTAKVKAKKDFILNVINTALNDIFQQDIKIEIRSSDEDQKIQEKQKKLQIKYDIILLENGIEIGRNERLLVSNGGGVLSVISLLLKILTGYIYSKNKFYVFDESLAQVSEIYQERLSLFLQQFCVRYGFTLILINHNPRLATHAHMAYTLGADKLKNGLKRLKIEKLDDMREENELAAPWFFEIENFQSIEKLNLEFQGFVSITGANNIGKSAIVRAINSLIFNSFQENYLRQGTQQALIKMSHDKRWAELIYKSKKVYYKFWDGTELSGKKLAQDKIQEKIEEIGFKFLNISKMYKNWKSDVKEQVDRLYVTTQYDKMYLIGSKSNDSDKLFNFLFNAETIAQALLNASYDLRSLTVEQKELFENKQVLEAELDKLKKKLKIEEFYFKKSVIENLRNKNSELEILKQNLNKINRFISAVENFIMKKSKIDQFKNIELETSALQLRVDKGNKIVKIITALLDQGKQYVAKKGILDNFKKNIDQTSMIQKEKKFFEYRLNLAMQLTEKLVKYKNAYDTVYRYKEVLDKISKGKVGQKQLQEWWEQMKTNLGIEICPRCQGLGYVHRA